MTLFAPVAWAQSNSASEQAANATSDRVVAVVNQDAITKRELNDRIKNVRRLMSTRGTALPSMADDKGFEKEVLESLILEHIQLQLAKERGINVSDQELDQAALRVAQDNKTDLAGFKKMIAQDGVSWQNFLSGLRNEIIINRLRQIEVLPSIVVSDSEIEQLLAAPEQADLLQRKVSQIRARHILIKKDGVLNQQEALHRMHSLLERLRNGEDFGELAKRYSEDFSAVKGGDLGWIYPGDTVPAFEEAMVRLQPGEISDVVQTPFGWHLIQVVEKREVNVDKERLRLLATGAIRERKFNDATREWLANLRDNAYVENLLDYY